MRKKEEEEEEKEGRGAKFRKTSSIRGGRRNEGIARIFAWGALNSTGTVIVRRLNEASGHEHALVCINICVGGSIHRESWSLLKTALFALAERTVSFLHATKGNIYYQSSVWRKFHFPSETGEMEVRSFLIENHRPIIVFIIFDNKIGPNSRSNLDKSSKIKNKCTILLEARTWKCKNIVSIVSRVSRIALQSLNLDQVIKAIISIKTNLSEELLVYFDRWQSSSLSRTD